MKAVDVDRVFAGTQGIKPQRTDDWLNFDEANSEYSEGQMESFLDNNGDRMSDSTIGIEFSPDDDGKFVGVDLDYTSDSSNGSSSSGNRTNESVERQKAFAEVREWFSDAGHDPAEMDRQDYQKFIAMFKDAKELISDGDFEGSSHFAMQLIQESDEELVTEENVDEFVEEGDPSEEDIDEDESSDEEEPATPAESTTDNDESEQSEASSDESDDQEEESEEDDSVIQGSEDKTSKEDLPEDEDGNKTLFNGDEDDDEEESESDEPEPMEELEDGGEQDE